MNWLQKYRTPIIIFLVGIIASGGAVFIYRQAAVNAPLEIILVPPSQQIVVDVRGEVKNPGFYTLSPGTCVADAVEAAGGFTINAAQSEVALDARVENWDYIYIPSIDEAAQRVNINTAEKWLLTALPGIGEVRATNIINSRNSDGFFTITYDLVDRNIISDSLYNEIKDKIKVY